jgi:2-keto-4-pentenoate hydratase/2-oxohepta-3-ene-1,7-dioic acid hydratase in catechol pathway
MTIYARFHHGGERIWGELEDGRWLEIRDLLGAKERTGRVFAPESVKFLAPCEPTKILAVGRNFKSHLHGRPQPQNPELFYKPLSCLAGPEEEIVLPPDATNAHYEGELVVMVGKRLRKASREEAAAAVFGVTCGNDVSERTWQNGKPPGGEGKDIQWWRAKGSDTFGTVGPVLVTGLDPDDLLLETRLNGEIVQHERTSDLIFDVPETLAFVSRYVTLEPGDIIYTGTPGNTKALKPGDVVEVEIEGVGVLRNRVVAGS